MALFRKKEGLSAHKWRSAAADLNAAENNGFNPDMVKILAPKAFMF